jgi:hypothetical protein
MIMTCMYTEYVMARHIRVIATRYVLGIGVGIGDALQTSLRHDYRLITTKAPLGALYVLQEYRRYYLVKLYVVQNSS